MLQQNLKPKYEVERLEGTRKRKKFQYERETLADGRTILARREIEVEEPNGFMLYTAHGDSVHLSEAQLRQFGINPDAQPMLFDEETGEEVAPPMSLARLAKARETVKRGK